MSSPTAQAGIDGYVLKKQYLGINHPECTGNERFTEFIQASLEKNVHTVSR